MTRSARSLFARVVVSSLMAAGPAVAISAQPLQPSNQPVNSVSLDRATLDDVELEYTVRGTGEPVLLIHAGVFADWFVPRLEEPRLAAGYQLIHYHRLGYAGSSRPAGPVSIA